MKGMTLIIGGSGSGKSEFAEELAKTIEGNRHIYLATMINSDDECDRKIILHQKRREGMGFVTVEKPTRLTELIDCGIIAKGDVVLLECISNLLANEMFMQQGRGLCDDYSFIADDIIRLGSLCDMVIVSNQVSLDGSDYDEVSLKYIKAINHINGTLSKYCDAVYEVVCGIPICLKGKDLIYEKNV